MDYHISRQGKTYGPYPEQELQAMLARREVLPDDLCWTEGMNGWLPLRQVLPQPAPPPTPAPAAPAQPPAARQLEQPYSAPQSHRPAPPAQFQRAAQPAAPRPMAPAWPYGGAAPAHGAAMAQAALPPNLHWGLVLLLSVFTCGIFGIVWLFVEAGFVKKIDPQSKAAQYFFGYIAIIAAAMMMSFVIRSFVFLPIQMLLPWAGLALLLVGVFQMRTSIERHYNTAENINLRLSPIMTCFFNMLYFQYHFTRIANWKRTGRLE